MKKRTQDPSRNKHKNSHTLETASQGLNYGTNKTIEENVNMPRGAESNYKDELLQKKTNQHSLSKRLKQ